MPRERAVQPCGFPAATTRAAPTRTRARARTVEGVRNALVLLVALAAAGTAQAATKPPARVQIQIVHALRGCHQWGNGVATFGAAYNATVRTGGRVDVRESEQMIFDVTQLAGPAIDTGDQLVPGETQSFRFAKPGTYRLQLVNTERSTDVGLQSLGDDNVLTLTVRVR